MIETKYDIIPRMNTDDCLNTLTMIGRKWQGQGCAIELGCWIGASSVALLNGLNLVGYDKPFYAFDRWIANRQQVQEGNGIVKRAGQDLHSIFLENVLSIYTGQVVTKQGNLPDSLKTGYCQDYGKIEICVFDAPKTNPIFTECVRQLYEHWIPGVTILCLLDYNFYKRKEGKERNQLMAPVEFMKKNEGCFSLIHQQKGESASFFRYEKPLINI